MNGTRVPSTIPVSPSNGPNAVLQGREGPAPGNTDTTLSADPRIGIYTNTNLNGGFVEGGIADVRVHTLDLGSPVGATASSSYYPAGHAIDRNPGSFWVANTGGSQWIEIDLGSVIAIRKIRLLTEQSGGAYETLHQVLVGTSPAPTGLSVTFAGVTTTGSWLDHTFVDAAVEGRYVRIQSPTSQSWRAWREIEVYR